MSARKGTHNPSRGSRPGVFQLGDDVGEGEGTQLFAEMLVGFHQLDASAQQAGDGSVQARRQPFQSRVAFRVNAGVVERLLPSGNAQESGRLLEDLPGKTWHLQQVRAHEQATGTRLVDVLDVHFYPQANGVALSNDESAGTAAVRLRSVKLLHDAAYRDESWIMQPVRLVPRLREMIDAHAPGLRLAITEYNWGNDDGLTSALAQAEVLALFGR